MMYRFVLFSEILFFCFNGHDTFSQELKNVSTVTKIALISFN